MPDANVSRAAVVVVVLVLVILVIVFFFLSAFPFSCHIVCYGVRWIEQWDEYLPVEGKFKTLVRSLLLCYVRSFGSLPFSCFDKDSTYLIPTSSWYKFIAFELL